MLELPFCESPEPLDHVYIPVHGDATGFVTADECSDYDTDVDGFETPDELEDFDEDELEDFYEDELEYLAQESGEDDYSTI